MGMGVAFTGLDDSQAALIKTWIERLVSPSAAIPSRPDHSENTTAGKPPNEQEALAVP
jgi:hypothetical protein